jgi:hypothetical protein
MESFSKKRKKAANYTTFYLLKIFEPGSFCSGGGRDDHYATPPRARGDSLIDLKLAKFFLTWRPRVVAPDSGTEYQGSNPSRGNTFKYVTTYMTWVVRIFFMLFNTCILQSLLIFVQIFSGKK